MSGGPTISATFAGLHQTANSEAVWTYGMQLSAPELVSLARVLQEHILPAECQVLPFEIVEHAQKQQHLVVCKRLRHFSQLLHWNFWRRHRSESGTVSESISARVCDNRPQLWIQGLARPRRRRKRLLEQNVISHAHGDRRRTCLHGQRQADPASPSFGVHWTARFPSRNHRSIKTPQARHQLPEREGPYKPSNSCACSMVSRKSSDEALTPPQVN